jgi:hypothetical protein
MIEQTDEMVQVAEEAAHDHGVFLHDHQSKAILTAVLALVERDNDVRPHRKPKPGRGVSHPHYCLSCSDGETKGAGCMNCRQTGFDQTPWPTCGGCVS